MLRLSGLTLVGQEEPETVEGRRCIDKRLKKTLNPG